MSRRRTVAGPRAAKKREAVKNRVVPVLAVLLWIGASGAARGAETIADPSAGKDAPPPKEVRASCVNAACIRELQPWFHGDQAVILKDGTQLTLSRTFREGVGKALGQSI